MPKMLFRPIARGVGFNAVDRRTTDVFSQSSNLDL